MTGLYYPTTQPAPFAAPLSPQEIMLGEMRIAQHMAAKGRTDIPTLHEIMEADFQRSVTTDTRAIIERMTTEEQMNIAFVPLIISHLAWVYADKALDIARREKVAELKPLSRKVKELRTDYIHMLQGDLNAMHIRGIEDETERFLNLCNYDFTVFYYTVNNEVKRVAPELQYNEIITYAFISVLMVRALRHHNNEVNALLLERLGPDKESVTNPFLVALETLMLACTNGCPLKLDGQLVQLCMNIFYNNLNRIEFNIIHGD
jgi:hypothetical protein